MKILQTKIYSNCENLESKINDFLKTIPAESVSIKFFSTKDAVVVLDVTIKDENEEDENEVT